MKLTANCRQMLHQREAGQIATAYRPPAGAGIQCIQNQQQQHLALPAPYGYIPKRLQCLFHAQARNEVGSNESATVSDARGPQ
jgi:hypothetical protein